MTPIKPTKTVYTVSNFLDWQRAGSLELKPTFQRREVWSSKAKSMFIDSIVKGLPIPIIFLRSRQDLQTYSSKFEVVDGQQRLRTLFSFIDPSVLSDFEATRDEFLVLKAHNKEVGNKAFASLDADIRSQILGYELSTHVLPPDTADDVVLRIFARMNSTGAKLNAQELRNSQFFGAFKTMSYDLAIGSLPHWRKWKVFDDDSFARMLEVETTSDLLSCMIDGLHGKTKDLLDRYYASFDDDFGGAEVLFARFQRVMTELDDAVGEAIGQTVFRRSALFFSLFCAVYDHMYGLGSGYGKRRTAKQLPARFEESFKRVDKMIATGKLPDHVKDAVDKATADTGRRLTRHEFFVEELSLVSAN